MQSSTKLLAGAFVGLLLAACSSSSTNNPTDGGASDSSAADAANPDAASPDASGDGGACELVKQTGDKTCDQCLGSNCCEPFNACAGDDDCSALSTCIATCAEGKNMDGGTFDAADIDGGATDCVNACADAHKASVTKFMNMRECVITKCTPEDGGPNAC